MAGVDYDIFLDALGMRESGGDYKAENTLGYIGKYQMGEAILNDLGYYSFEGDDSSYRVNDWTGQWLGKGGIFRKSSLKAIREYRKKPFVRLWNCVGNGSNITSWISMSERQLRASKSPSPACLQAHI